MSKRSQTKELTIVVDAESLFKLVQDIKRADEWRVGHYYHHLAISLFDNRKDDDVVVVLPGELVDALSERTERDNLIRRYTKT